MKGTAYLLRKLGAVAGVLIFALIFLSAFAASVRAAPLGITGYFGNLDGTAKVGGGFFSTTPRGVAVNDSSGDVYVADAGNNRLQRFDADGNFISAWGADVIPGGAAGTGNLTNGNNAITALVATNKAFVVGQTITGAGIPAGTTITGITAGPSSESKLTLSNSAEATVPGAIINVAEGAGNVAQNEQQVLTLTATGGNFKLTVQKSQGFGIETTANIPFNAAAAAVQSSLEALPAIGVGNVSVSSSNPGGGAEPGGPYVIEFKGKLADVNVPQMGTGTAGSPPLTGGSASVATSVQGGTAYEVCAIAAQCKSGVAIGSNGELGAPGGTLSAPQGIAISQASGDLYVTNQALQRVEQLSSSGAFVRAWGWDVVRSGKAGDKPPASAVQTLIVSATGGKYELEFQGQKTSGLLAGPSGTASEVQTALQLLPLIGSGNATVSGPAGGPYAITFAGALANNPEPDIVVSSSSSEPLIGGSATAGTTTPGSTGFEICSIAADCQKGRSEGGPGGAFTAGFASTVGYPAVASAGAPNAGNVLVPEVFGKRVREFSASGAVVRSFGAGVTAAGPGNTGSGFEICRAADSDVCAFGAAGAGAGEFATGGPTRLAVDTAGNIFTAEPVGNFRIQKFAPSGGSLTPTVFNPQIHSLSGEAPTAEFPLTGSSSADAPTDIAVDPTDNHLYVAKACTAPHCPGAANPAERRLYEFDTATGALVETHLAGYNVPAINGLGLRAGGEAAYLSSSTPKAGVYIAGPPTPPHATIETPTGLNAECATFHGAVNPEGGGPLGLLHTSYRFEYRPTGSSGPWGKIPASDIDLGAGGAPVAVEQTACGLQPNRQYGVKLVAIKGGSPVTAGPITFTTDPAGPLAQTFEAFFDANAKELVLRGSVNPNNTATTYYFEYGTSPCSSSTCTAVPVSKDASAGSGGEPVTVSQRLAGLEPETTYHFRLIADNGVGAAVVGPEEELTTPPDEPCANSQLRTGPSAALPECRAYEWVSNGDSWGSGINGIVGSIADGGDRAQFQAQAFGQPPSVPGPSTPYTAERTASGWEVSTMLPPGTLANGSYTGTRFMSSGDLASTLWPEATIGQRLRGEVAWGLQQLGGGSQQAYSKMVPLERVGGNRSDEYPLLGASGDLSAFVFNYSGIGLPNSVRLFPDERLFKDQARTNLYEVSDTGGPGAKLHLVNRESDPSLGVSGDIIGGACGAGLGGKLKPSESASFARAVSTDGSVVYFSAIDTTAPAGGTCSEAPGKRLFKRIDNETTVRVSASQCSPACGGPGGDDNYRGASADGEVVYFTTPRQLTGSDTDTTQDLYVYDESLPASERLIQASAGEVVAGDHPTIGSGAEVLSVLDNSADGSRAYFVAKGRLTAAATKGANNVYVFERDSANPGGRIDFVGALASDEANSLASSYALPGGEDGDGHFLLFTTTAKLLAEDTDSRKDLYRYDDESGDLDCISCMGEGNFDVKIAERPTEASWADYSQHARPASADVSTVVFTTAEDLSDEDLNGANDAYRWQEGLLSLVSAGSGEAGVQGSTRESGISADGKNVFFVTRTPMVGADVNNGLDLYDARVGGGFAEAPPPPHCTKADACQGPPPPPPPPVTPSTGSFNGAGNVKPPKKCKKGFVRKKGKCVKKHKPARHKNKGGKGKKRANDNRGAKR